MSFLRRLFGGRTETSSEINAWLLNPARSDAALDIVGEGSYQQALEVISGGRTPDGPANREQTAVLIPEPRNQYDRNAIQVQIAAKRVGYLSRENALLYQPVVRWALGQGHYIAAHAYLTGGWDRGPRDKGTIGVLLHLGTPAETIVELLTQDQAARLDHPWAGWLVAFTGDSTCRVAGFVLDRPASIMLAERGGLSVHPRITKKVQLLVDCDRSGKSINESKAEEYGIPVVDELDFWRELGVPAERLDWTRSR